MKVLKVFMVISIILLICSFDFNLQSKKNYKGISITLTDNINNDAWYDSNFPKIKKVSNQLEVVTAVTVQNKNDSNPVNDPNIQDKLDRLFKKANQYGLKVTLLKPHIMLPNFDDGFDRGSYYPKDMKAFFEKWKSILLYYASVSNENNIPILSLTCETPYLTHTNCTQYWIVIVNELKGNYPNLKLTMALKYGELKREIEYHDANIKCDSDLVDYISLNMYPTIKRENAYSFYNQFLFLMQNKNANLYAPWDDDKGYLNLIRKTKASFGKKVLITEIGCTNRSDKNNPNISPSLLDKKMPIDNADQNIWMNTVLRSVLNENDVEGVYIWHFNSPFNFAGTPTEKTIRTLFINN